MAILYRIIISLLVLCVSTSAISQHDNNHNVENHDAESHDSKNEKQEVSIVENVLNHISDAHDWHFFSFKGHHYSIPLPVILLTDGNLDVFMSSEFHHGHSEVKKDNRTYTIDKGGKISEASGLSIIDFSITKNVASMFIALIVLIA